jgi:signal transduction histidine kinase
MIIEHFGGRAWVEAAPGGGAIFQVWLPREPAAASAA